MMRTFSHPLMPSFFHLFTCVVVFLSIMNSITSTSVVVSSDAWSATQPLDLTSKHAGVASGSHGPSTALYAYSTSYTSSVRSYGISGGMSTKVQPTPTPTLVAIDVAPGQTPQEDVIRINLDIPLPQLSKDKEEESFLESETAIALFLVISLIIVYAVATTLYLVIWRRRVKASFDFILYTRSSSVGASESSRCSSAQRELGENETEDQDSADDNDNRECEDDEDTDEEADRIAREEFLGEGDCKEADESDVVPELNVQERMEQYKLGGKSMTSIDLKNKRLVQRQRRRSFPGLFQNFVATNPVVEEEESFTSSALPQNHVNTTPL